VKCARYILVLNSLVSDSSKQIILCTCNACLLPRHQPERWNIARIKCLQNCRIGASL